MPTSDVPYCMDRNNSLNRLQRLGDENQERLSTLSQKRMDSCDGWEDYFLSQDEVDAWSKDAIGKSIVTDPRDTDGNPYTDQWVNMKNDMNLSM